MKKIGLLLLFQAVVLLVIPLIASYVATARDLDLERHWRTNIGRIHSEAVRLTPEEERLVDQNRLEHEEVLAQMFRHQRRKDNALEFILYASWIVAAGMIGQGIYLIRLSGRRTDSKAEPARDGNAEKPPGVERES
jgi:hypothetical protein